VIAAGSKIEDAAAETLVQHAACVREHARRRGRGLEQAQIGGLQARVHRVRRRHGGQGEEQALRPSRLHQPVRQDERGLGLASAGHVLDHEQRRPLGDGDDLGPLLQRGRWRDRGEQRVHAGARSGSAWRQAGLGDGARCARQRMVRPVRAQGVDAVGRDGREPPLRGADPVREHGEPCQPPCKARDIVTCKTRERSRIERRDDRLGRRSRRGEADPAGGRAIDPMVQRKLEWRPAMMAGDSAPQAGTLTRRPAVEQRDRLDASRRARSQ
jgi:hypothetical protein